MNLHVIHKPLNRDYIDSITQPVHWWSRSIQGTRVVGHSTAESLWFKVFSKHIYLSNRAPQYEVPPTFPDASWSHPPTCGRKQQHDNTNVCIPWTYLHEMCPVFHRSGPTPYSATINKYNKHEHSLHGANHDRGTQPTCSLDKKSTP